ncbi:MAG: hypothetical protein RR623_04885 [Bacilli bacterium]
MKKAKRKKLILITTLIFLCIDILCSLIFIGYHSNILPIALLGYVLSKQFTDKNKVLIGYVITFSCILLIGYNLTDKAYLKVKMNNKKVKIEVPSFSINKGKNSDGSIKIKILKNSKTTDKKIQKYLNKLETGTCLSYVFYDKSQNISLIDYYIKEGNYIDLKVKNNNYCNIVNNKIKYDTYKNFVLFDEIKEEYTIAKSIEDGYFVVDGSTLHNENDFKRFNKQIEDNKDAFIRIITSSNGFPVITDIYYKNNSYEINYDNKRDVNNNPSKTLFQTFNNLKINEGYLTAYSFEPNDGIVIAKVG